MGKIIIPCSAYLHIPFCRRRCYYCDFPISVLGDKTDIETSPSINEYVEILCSEILNTPNYGDDLSTIFFGGGTPSLLPVSCLEKILLALTKRFGIAQDAEISLEIDPGTFNNKQLQGYLNAGVNRISLGAQAFQDELLQNCGRFHGVKDIFSAVELIKQLNCSVWSLDLISGLPTQTMSQWRESLHTAISLAPNHLSCYDLVLEPVTAFGKKYQPGESPLPSDATTAQMYRLAQQTLTKGGFEHYEISNYAQPGYQCHHNRVYWKNQPYYAFGMGAASYIENRRFSRPRTRKTYYEWVAKMPHSSTENSEAAISGTDLLLETLMLGLRLAEGIKATEIQGLFGQTVWEQIINCLEPYAERGWVLGFYNKEPLVFSTQKQLIECDRIRLSDPEGFLYSNTVLAALFERMDSVPVNLIN